MTLILLCCFSFLAGLIDSMAGGGGLIQLPALATLYPHLSTLHMLAINKGASICGTFIASISYSRRVSIDWTKLRYAVFFAFIFSLLGAWVVLKLSQLDLRPFIITLLILVFLYTLKKKNFGDSVSSKTKPQSEQKVLNLAVASPVGFYDGFFGPGTGGFFTFLLIRLLGYDFLKATATAKVLNFTTNCAAVIFFVIHQKIIWAIALPMALSNMLGGWFGSRLAMKKGNLFVRKVFLVVTLSLIIKLSADWIF